MSHHTQYGNYWGFGMTILVSNQGNGYCLCAAMLGCASCQQSLSYESSQPANLEAAVYQLDWTRYIYQPETHPLPDREQRLGFLMCILAMALSCNS